MINEFNFEYFVPTPDTTANCALSRWNDGVCELSEFIKSYMSAQQDVCFGFNRPLNITELIKLKTGNAYGEKQSYLLDYTKYGALKAKICGYDVPLLNKEQNFLFLNWYYDENAEKFVNKLSVNRIAHVINKNSEYNSNTRKSKFIEAINAIIYDIQNEYSDEKIKYYFGESSTKSLAITSLNNVIAAINNLNNYQSDFIFGFNDKEDFSNNVITRGYTWCNYNSESYTEYIDDKLFSDLAWISDSVEPNETPVSPELPFVLENINQIFCDYFATRGLDIVLQKTINPAITNINCYDNGHIFICFRFLLKEYPVPSKFLSHDGTYIPLSKQTILISPSLVPTTYCHGNGNTLPVKILWDSDEEKLIYINENGDSDYLTLEPQSNNIGGIDYTIWSTPVQKTSNGYKFECIMPLAFYNSASGTYNNEYYSTKTGEVLYRVPVFRKLRQNVEDVIFDEQKTRALNKITMVDDSNYNSANTVVLGGAVIDEFTNQLYNVIDKQEFASKNDYGTVMLQSINEDFMTELLKYSSGESEWNLPLEGRAIDGVGAIDLLNNLVYTNLTSESKLIATEINNGDINLYSDDFLLYSKTQITITSETSVDIGDPCLLSVEIPNQIITVGTNSNIVYDNQADTLTLNVTTTTITGDLIVEGNLDISNIDIGTEENPLSNLYSSRLTVPITDDDETEESTNTLIIAGNTTLNNAGSLIVTAYYHYRELNGVYTYPDNSVITLSSAIGNTQDIRLTFENDNEFKSKLRVSSVTNKARSTFEVNVFTNITEDARVEGNLAVWGTLNVSEEFNINGYFEVTGTSFLDGNCTVEGDLTVNGLIQGLTPMASTTIQVGAIVLVFINPLQALMHYTAGQTLDSSDLGVLSMYFAKVKTTGEFETTSSNLRQVTINSSMQFTLMNDISQNGYSVALVQRIK